MATTPHTEAGLPVPPPSSDASIPPLRNGDRLTRPEFERRYNAMPHLKKAELIEGIVYIPSPDFWLAEGGAGAMPSPVSLTRHGRPHYKLIAWLSRYSEVTPGLTGGDNASLRLDLDNVPQPAAFLLIDAEYGGQGRVDADGYVEGAPELVAEVAYSSASYDLHAKLHVYRRNEAREYIVWRVEDGAIDWFVLREGRYIPLEPDREGVLRSEVFPGLRLDTGALLRLDMPAVFRAVDAGLASAECATFNARLQETAARLGTRGPVPRGDRP